MRYHVSRWVLLAALMALLAACGQQVTTPPTLDDAPVRSTAVPTHVEQVFPLEPVPFDVPSGMVNETPDVWFVEFAGAPSVEGGRGAAQANERAIFRSAALAQGIEYEERYDFATLFNGLSVRASPRAIGQIARLPGVSAVWPVVTVAIPETRPVFDPDLATALAMTGADVVQHEYGFTGRGIRVAVMDTGIDYNHPDLGGCFGPGCRVEVGWDFVGDDFDARDPSAEPAPDPDPMDPNGHGTHVAGIVGANGSVTGVAPDVTFGAYKVFGREGSTTADIMLAAMEMALHDGMDVLNMSIGAAFQWPQYPTAIAASRLVNRGMVVVASIGNSGASGVYSAGAPGLGDKVIGVASFDNTNVEISAFTVSPDDASIGYGVAAAAPEPPTSGTYPMVRTGTTATPDDACFLITEDLTGHVALIRRGTCPFHTKALNAQNAGAAAVVLYNNSTGRFSPTVAGEPAITIPVVAISDTEGALIDGRLADGPVDMTWTAGTLVDINPTGGLISSFSSYGLSPDLTLKPDIGAPGGLIRSTYPLALGGYATISGTSMSAPHVAGAAALLLEAKPRIPSQQVRNLLQNTAQPAPWWGNPGLGFLDNVHRQGAGMLDIAAAITATTKIEPGKISAGASDAGPYTQQLRIENSGSEAVTYDLSFVNALSTGGSTFDPGFFLGNATVAFDRSSITVRPGGSATVRATINPATAPVGGQYGGYVVFTPRGGGQTYRVPFAGYIGNYQERVVLAAGAVGFPLLGWSPDGEYFGLAAPGDVFTMEGFDVPYVLVHLAHQSRRLRIEVFDAHTGRAWRRAYDLEYLPRNATSAGFFALGWDGVTLNGRNLTEVPDGDYVLRLSVQKALGHDNDPSHWETWTSPMFTIARPVIEPPPAPAPEHPGRGRGR